MWLSDKYDSDHSANSLEFASKRRVPVLFLSCLIFLLEFSLISVDEAFQMIGITPPPAQLIHIFSWILLLYFFISVAINIPKLRYEYPAILKNRALEIDEGLTSELKKRAEYARKQRDEISFKLAAEERERMALWSNVFFLNRSPQHELAMKMEGYDIEIEEEMKHVEIQSTPLQSEALFDTDILDQSRLRWRELYSSVNKYNKQKDFIIDLSRELDEAQDNLSNSEKRLRLALNPTDPRSQSFIFSELTTDIVRIFSIYIFCVYALIKWNPNFDISSYTS